jgi:putative hemolysin
MRPKPMALSPTLLAQMAALLLLFGCSAFFSMAETAMIGVSRWEVRRLAEQGSARARLVDAMLDDPERVLSTVLVGNTVVNISAAALGTLIAEAIFSRLSTLIATLFVTAVVLILCELVPKTIAVHNPLRIALAFCRPLRLVESVLKPAIAASSMVAKALVRPFGIRAKGKAPFLTTDEIEMLVRMGVEQGHVEKFEQRVITELFDFTETPIERIMTPAAKVKSLPKAATLAEALRLAGKEGRSRILIVDGDFGHVLGFVHIKDLLHYDDDQLEVLPVTLALRSCLTASASTRADRLLVRMQREHRSLAVVQSADGQNIGIVTADDLLEELVGEIHDEFDAARTRRQSEAPARAPRPE